MPRTRITVDVDPEVRRRIRLAVADRDETIKDFVERAILHELAHSQGFGGIAGQGAETPGDEQEYYPAEGPKPTGLENAPKPRSGRTVAETVIEDRR